MAAAPIYLFAGGGTGGHLFPGIAVARELKRRDPDSRHVFVGSNRTIEASIASEQQLEHRTLPVESLTTLKRNPVRFLIQNLIAWRDARRLLKEMSPSAVIGLGGFASAPLAWAASRRRIPVILLEQNIIPGRTTRWLSRLANRICVTFDDTKLPHSKNVVVTGNPVRSEIADLFSGDLGNANRSAASGSKPQLLILGGSQGADSLNDAVMAVVRNSPDLRSSWSIVHQTGPRQADQIRQVYQQLGIEATVEPFFHDMATRYAATSLAISRAGATTLSELACVGIPMILMPYPHAADDHQRANANVFEKSGAAIVVEHAATSESTANELAQAIQKFAIDQHRLNAMSQAAKTLARPHAATTIADAIATVIEERRQKR